MTNATELNLEQLESITNGQKKPKKTRVSAIKRLARKAAAHRKNEQAKKNGQGRGQTNFGNPDVHGNHGPHQEKLDG